MVSLVEWTPQILHRRVSVPRFADKFQPIPALGDRRDQLMLSDDGSAIS